MTKTTITLNELATLSNLTTRRLRQLSDEGKLPKITRGSLAMPDAINKLFAHYQKDSEELTRERLAIATANRKTKEFELAKLEGKTIELATAERAIIGFGKRYHGFTRAETEVYQPRDRRAKLSELGLPEEIVTKFYEWDVKNSQAVIDRIEEACAVFANSSNAEMVDHANKA